MKFEDVYGRWQQRRLRQAEAIASEASVAGAGEGGRHRVVGSVSTPCEGAVMAKTLVRPSLYDQDFLAWTEQQAALLRAGRLDQLDLDNLAEELDTMGRSEWGELENRLEVLLMHMLKWDHQPARRSRSWKATMREQRNAIRRLHAAQPGLEAWPGDDDRRGLPRCGGARATRRG